MSLAKNDSSNSKIKLKNKIRYGILTICLFFVAALFLILIHLFWGKSVKSNDCEIFNNYFKEKLTSGLQDLLDGKSEIVVTVENKLKADIIVLCKSYSNISSEKLIQAGMSKKMAGKIDIPYLAEGAYFYLLKDNHIVCEGHTIKADLVANEIISIIDRKISITLKLQDTNLLHDADSKIMQLDASSINHAMLITCVR
ncbi:MAG: hypothetical protein KAS96_00050 [Planctomycetes bacterium]|nr:hypothetical protein [Planctomycetota bacterium]